MKNILVELKVPDDFIFEKCSWDCPFYYVVRTNNGGQTTGCALEGECPRVVHTEVPEEK